MCMDVKLEAGIGETNKTQLCIYLDSSYVTSFTDDSLNRNINCDKFQREQLARGSVKTFSLETQIVSRTRIESPCQSNFMSSVMQLHINYSKRLLCTKHESCAIQKVVTMSGRSL
jgi:hypothetical protein